MSDTASHPSVDETSTSEQLNDSDLYSALADERRRIALDVLTTESPPVDASSLAREVAGVETDEEPEDAPTERVERVHAELHHVHLPKLAHLGLVEYDRDAGTVTAVADGLDAVGIRSPSP